MIAYLLLILLTARPGFFDQLRRAQQQWTPGAVLSTPVETPALRSAPTPHAVTTCPAGCREWRTEAGHACICD